MTARWTCLVLLTLGATAAAQVPEEFRIKREAVFEFAGKPTVTRDGDRITIAFESKAFCDVTVAIENGDGEIVRHLASGVLGENAPAPFAKKAKRQAIVWDSKDDAGRYVADPAACTVRVSLGLRGEWERSLFFSPYKRMGAFPPVIAASPEGVFVFDGQGVDLLRQYNHSGDYVRTLYPFAADQLDKVVGLSLHRPPQLPAGAAPLPKKLGYEAGTLLTSGGSASTAPQYAHGNGYGASAMAVRNGRIALAHINVNRLTTDGTTGGLPLTGPQVGFEWQIPRRDQGRKDIGPTSVALSPDGKTLYLTGYVWHFGLYGSGGEARNGVYKVDYAADAQSKPAVFAGNMEMNKTGRADGEFALPTSVDVDSAGRVYVSDYLNDRVQIFDAAGKHLANIAAEKPTRVCVDPRNGEIYVFSWWIGSMPNNLYKPYNIDREKMRNYQSTLTRFGPFGQTKQLDRWDLLLPPSGGQLFASSPMWNLELDFWAADAKAPPTLWAVGRKGVVDQTEVICWGKGVIDRAGGDPWIRDGIYIYRLADGKWEPQRQFSREAAAAIHRVKPPDLGIMRLYTNPKNHRLYLLEHQSFAKCNGELIEIDPVSGKCRAVALPFRAEDICFDQNGWIYLRTDFEVVRYDPVTWREIPWDYGEERADVGFSGQPRAKVASALPLPGARPMWFHQYGMWVSPRGHLAVSCVNRSADPKERTPGDWKGEVQAINPTQYTPQVYPGRARHQEIHIWDEHGRLVTQDAVPGSGIFNGLGIDKDDNIYLLSQGTRNVPAASEDGEASPYPNPQTGTLVKMPAGACKVLSATRNQTKRYVPFAPQLLAKEDFPPRPPDTVGRGEAGNAWFQGAKWLYGGVGIVGVGCVCWHTRFQLDAFARSFAPEPDLYSVAVLDTNGNLVTRIGRYGNIDDAGKGHVALFFPAYVGVDTDRRLFVSDIGNYRIAGIKLDYHATERVSLKGK